MIASQETDLHTLHLARLLRLLRHDGPIAEVEAIAQEIKSGAWPVNPKWVDERGNGLVAAILGNREIANTVQAMELLGALVLSGCPVPQDLTTVAAGASQPARLFLSILEPGQSQQQVKRQWAACMVMEIASQAKDIIPSSKHCIRIMKSSGGWGGPIQGMEPGAWIGMMSSPMGEGGGIGLGSSGLTMGQKKNVCRIMQRTLVTHESAPRTPLESWLFNRAMKMRHDGRWDGSEGESGTDESNNLGSMRVLVDQTHALGDPLITQKVALQVIVATCPDNTSKQAAKLLAHCLELLDDTPNGLHHACKLWCVNEMLWENGPNPHLPGTFAVGKALAISMERMTEHTTPWPKIGSQIKQWMAKSGDDAMRGVANVITSMDPARIRREDKKAMMEGLALWLGCNHPEPASQVAAPRL